MTDRSETVAVPVAVLAEWRRVLTAISYGELDWGDDADEATKCLHMVCEVETCYRESGKRSKLCDEHSALYKAEYSPGDTAPAGEQMAAYGQFLREIAA